MRPLALLVAGVQHSLTGLYQTIEARLALYKPLASLQGRLDLVLAQAAPVDPLASRLAAGPLVSPIHSFGASTFFALVIMFFNTASLKVFSTESDTSVKMATSDYHSHHDCIYQTAFQAPSGVRKSVHGKSLV